MSKTEEKRNRFHKRYARKDARTRIYRALYGIPTRADPKGWPPLNETRKLEEGMTYTVAEHVWMQFKELAAFDETTEGVLVGRLVSLKSILAKKERE